MNRLSTPLDQPTNRRRFLTAAGTLAAATSMAGPAQAATSARRHPHEYEELLPEESYEEQKRAPIIYLPIGARALS